MKRIFCRECGKRVKTGRRLCDACAGENRRISVAWASILRSNKHQRPAHETSRVGTAAQMCVENAV